MLITFFKRTFSSVLLLALFFGAIFLPGKYGYYVFCALVIFLSFFSVREFTMILRKSGHEADALMTPFFTTLTAVAALMGRVELCILAAALFVAHKWLLFLTSGNQKKGMYSILNSCAAYFMFVIPIILMVFIYRENPLLFLYLIIVTKISDIGAYVTGTLCHVISGGKNHKMVPSISPGKSYEGAVGGIAFAIGASYLLWSYAGLDFVWWKPLVSGIVLFFGSVAGDLSESVFKRICEVKDSGKILPGIGGIFDLVDSMLVNAIIFYFFLYFRIF